MKKLNSKFRPLFEIAEDIIRKQIDYFGSLKFAKLIMFGSLIIFLILILIDVASSPEPK